MNSERMSKQSGEIHGMDSDGWAEFYGFEAIKDYPYNPATEVHFAGKTEDGSDITISSRELLEIYLKSSIVKDGGESFIGEVADKGAALIRDWFVEVEPGKYEFDMSRKA